jgi:hypothetical protein
MTIESAAAHGIFPALQKSRRTGSFRRQNPSKNRGVTG